MQGFSLNQVVPLPMADVSFSLDSVWNNQVTIDARHTLIIAPSGSGKTSLFAFLYGLRSNYTGNIAFDGKDINLFNLRQWSDIRKKDLSVIFQDLRLIPHLSVKDNLLLKNRLTANRSEEEIKHLLDQLGVADKWQQSCGTLSFGQQQRVSIVRALLQPFRFLLADEPFSHIDERNIEKARALLLDECKKQNATLILFSLGSAYGIHFDKTMVL